MSRLLAVQLTAVKLPPEDLEYRFHPVRFWRFDFAWPSDRIACEIEGLTSEGGRHQRMDGYSRDCEKYSEAAILGWMVVRVTQKMIKSGMAVELVERAHAARRADRRDVA